MPTAKRDFVPVGEPGRKDYLKLKKKSDVIRLHRHLFDGEDDAGVEVLDKLEKEYLIERIIRKESELLKERSVKHSDTRIEDIVVSASSPRLIKNEEKEEKGRQKMSKEKTNQEFEPYILEPKTKEVQPFRQGTIVQKVAELMKDGATEKELLDAMNSTGVVKELRHIKNYCHYIATDFGIGIEMRQDKDGETRYYLMDPDAYEVKVPKSKLKEEKETKGAVNKQAPKAKTNTKTKTKAKKPTKTKTSKKVKSTSKKVK